MDSRPTITADELPQRRKALAWGRLATLVLAIALPLLPPVKLLDLKFLDAQFALRRALQPTPAARDVALVGIDEETLRRLPEPVTLWHAHLGQFMAAMAAAKPRAVGFDLALPDRSLDFIVPGSDAALMKGLLALRRSAPLVLGIAVGGDGRPRTVYPPFLSLAGPAGAGYLLWQVDPDQTVRRFDENLGKNGAPLPTLAGQMARLMGAHPGPGLVDYALGPPFSYVPLWQVLDWQAAGDRRALEQAFGGKPVLVGSVLPFEDRHFQPVNLAGWEENGRYAPGVLIHAQALRSFLGHGPIRTVSLAAVLALALTAAALLWTVGRKPVAGGALLVAGIIALAGLGFWLLGRGWFLPAAGPAFAALAGVSLRTGTEAWLAMAERRRLRGTFSGYVSPPVLREILAGRLTENLGGSRRPICVLFADIRNFTTLSESLPAEETIALLNRYFERMTAAIHDQEGTVDKFIGDGIMAFFGAPNTLDAPCRRAFAAAKAMLENLAALNAELMAENRQPLHIGIGLHFGEAVVGHAGSALRHEYTAIGDTVNVASRIEGKTKDAGYALLCSEAVVKQLDRETEFDDQGELPLKGHTPMRIHGWRPAKT